MADAPAMRLPYPAERMEEQPILTERLRLRPITLDDSDDVWDYQRREEVRTYIPWPRRTREEGHEHTAWRSGMRLLAADGDAILLVGELLGEPSLAQGGDRVVAEVMVRVTSVANAQVELGWLVHPSFQRRGLAAEGTAAALRLCFEELGAHRVHAVLDPRNLASAAICRRLGMRHEGTEREREYHDGAWDDLATFGILRREWSATDRPLR
ncbi:GNAT family N-acetyltransferase [Agromyces sp. SYSU T00194]|uniref:GNAT family N-acetyltransferase n=1 Tax=Agromyces chitinivorans TaxID=3158560 RepID=UPI00339925E1